jgi:TetR/AcrR family transcriptional regulator, transcriptional repressor for nem operon
MLHDWSNGQYGKGESAVGRSLMQPDPRAEANHPTTDLNDIQFTTSNRTSPRKVNQVVGGEVRRAAIVAIAARHVAIHGLEGLRLRDVARDVGIDHSTIHHYIATKQELIEAIASDAIARLQTSSPPPDTQDPIAAHLMTLATMMADQPELFVVTAELDLRAQRDAAVAAMLRDHEAGWRALLANLVDQHGEDPTEVAELIIATVKGVRLTPATAPAVLGRLLRVLAARSGEHDER